MPQKSNNELLSGILETLDKIIEAQEQNKASYNQQINVEVKNNKDIIALLTSMGNMSKDSNLKNVGTQVEALAKGLSSLSKINEKKIASTAKKLEFLVTKLGDVTKHMPKDADQTLQPLTEFIGKFTKLLNGNLFETLSKFGPISAIKAGLSISIFFRMLARTVAKMGPKALADITKTMSVKKDSADALNSIINTVMGIDPKALKKLSKAAAKLDPSGGQNIADFFKPIINVFPKNKKEAAAVALGCTEIINALTKLSLKAVLTLALFGKLVDQQKGENIYNFLDKILQLTKKYDKDEIQSLSNMFKDLSKAVLTLSIAIGVMVLIVTIAKIEDVLMALGIITLATVGLVGLAKWIGSKDTQKQMDAGIKGLEMLTKSALMVVAAIGVITLINTLFGVDSVLDGLFIVAITITGLVIASKFLAGKDTEDTINNGVKNLQTLCISLLMVTAAIGIMTLIVKTNDIGDVLLGTIITMAVITFLVGMTKWLSTIEEKQLSQANMTLIVLTTMLVAISLIAAFVLPQIGENFKDVLLGTLVVTGIIALMIFAVRWMTSWPEKQLEQATTTLGVLTVMLLAVSLIACFILPKIGENWEDAAIGGVVVMAIIGLMVGMVWFMTKWEEKQMKYAIWAIAALTVVLLAVSLIALYILPEIGENWKAAAIGGAVVLGTIAIMGLLVFLLGLIPKEKLIAGVLTIAGIAALLFALSQIFPFYIDLTKEVHKNWRTIAKGSTEIALTLGAWGVIFAAVGWFMTNGPYAEYVIAGAATVAGIAAVLWALGELLPSYIELAKNVTNNWNEIDSGNGYIVLTLTAWGLIFTAVGALIWGPQSLVVAAGAAAVTGIAAVLGALGELLPSYIKTARMMHKYKKEVKSGSEVIVETIGGFGAIFAAIGLLLGNPISALLIASGGATVLQISDVIKGLSKALDPFVEILKKIREYKITPRTIADFQNLFVGPSGKGGNDTLMGAITNIIDGLNDVGIYASTMAGIIGKNLKPIFETLSTFIDVVVKTCNMKYVSEWDENGKPIKYESITPAKFQAAGTAISVAFGIFLKQLATGLKLLDKQGQEAINALSKGIKPVMEAVGTFTNVILTLISSAIPVEWDENGKATKYRKFDKTEFGDAAVTIAEAFSTFMTTLTLRMYLIKEQSGEVVNALKDGIGPLMSAVNTQTNTIMGLLKGQEVTYTDINGKEVTEFMRYDPAKFKAAADQISDCFIGFIETLHNKFARFGHYEKQLAKAHLFTENEYKEIYHNEIGDIIASLNGLQPLLDSVSSYIDIIAAAVKKTESIDLQAQAIKMAGVFVEFLETMTTELSDIGDLATIQVTITNIKKSKEIAEVFTSIIDVLVKGFNKDITKLSADFVNSSVIPAVTTLLTITRHIAELNIEGKEIDLRDARKHAKYINEILTYFSEGLKSFKDVANLNPNYSFITGLVVELEKAYNASTVNYNKFIVDFARIDKQMREALTPYNTIANIAKDKTLGLAYAFQKLDNILKQKEKERTKILVKLKNNISDIAVELEKVNKAMQQNIQNQKKMDAMKTEMATTPIQTLASTLSTGSSTTPPPPRKAGETDAQYKQRVKEAQKNNTSTDITNIAMTIGAAVTNALNTWATKEWKVIITSEDGGSPWMKGNMKYRAR